MAKSFSVVITLSLGIALIVGGVLWWIGPNLASLAFVDSRRDEPFVVAEFVRGAAPASTEQMGPRYLQPLQQFVASEGGVAKPYYRLQHLANGRSADEWSHALFYQVPEAQRVAQLMTSSPYALMRESVDELRQISLGTYSQSEYANWRPSILICLVVGRESVHIDPLDALLADVATSGGRVVLNAQVDVLNSQAQWERMVVVDFNSTKDAMSWLNRPDILTERDITNSANREFAILLYEQALYEDVSAP